MRSTIFPGEYQCLTQSQKETNDTISSYFEEIIKTPQARSVDSCEACNSSEGCVLNGLSGYQCVSVGN